MPLSVTRKTSRSMPRSKPAPPPRFTNPTSAPAFVPQMTFAPCDRTAAPPVVTTLPVDDRVQVEVDRLVRARGDQGGERSAREGRLVAEGVAVGDAVGEIARSRRELVFVDPDRSRGRTRRGRNIVLDHDRDRVGVQRDGVTVIVGGAKRARQVERQDAGIGRGRRMIELVLQIEGEGAVAVVGDAEDFTVDAEIEPGAAAEVRQTRRVRLRWCPRGRSRLATGRPRRPSSRRCRRHRCSG